VRTITLVRIALLLSIITASAFIYGTAQLLPPMVASHFGAGGYANRFIPRGAYLRLMLGLGAGVPLATGFLMGAALNLPNIRINIPHRDYWLAPEQRPSTIAYVQSHMAVFSIMLTVFMAFVHWAVLRANQSTPPTLPWLAFLVGLAVFLTLTGVWAIALPLHFRRRRT
jgi:hypothetical protein